MFLVTIVKNGYLASAMDIDILQWKTSLTAGVF